MKTCSKCGETKPLTEYGKKASNRDGRQARCKPCVKVDKAESWQRNLESNRAKNREHYLANREARIAWQVAWKKANPDKVAEYGRTYNERHRDRANATARLRVAKRYALKLKRTVGEIDTDALWATQGGACGICEVAIDPALRWPHPMSKSLDHIHPLARGGAHAQDNLQWAHLVCNIRKGAKAS